MRTTQPLIFVLLMGICISAPAAAESPNLRRTFIVDVFEAHRDAVVNITTAQMVRQRFGIFEDDPFFRPFYRDVKRTSLGSGFIIHAEGYIVTNAHVVDGADEIEVILATGQHLPAAVLASDTRQDLAVLKVDPPPDAALRPVVLGDSSDLIIGEPVIAIGNPLGYEHTVTAGIVSAVNRELPVARDWSLQGLIQSDAAINPGNSGGPLLNAYGQVIGINTAIRGDAQNIGFAIPVNRLRDLVPELLSPLLVNRADIGGRVIEKRTLIPPAQLKVELQWHAAGEDRPQTLRAVNGRHCATAVDAYVELLKLKPGQIATLQGDDRQTITCTVRPAPLHDGQRLARAALGAEVRELSSEDRRRLGLGRVSGLIITAVETGGPADRAGLRRNDVIVQLGRYRIDNLDRLALLLSQVEAPARADVYVVRDGRLGRAVASLRGGGSEPL